MLITTGTQIDVNNCDIGRIGSNYYNGRIDEVRIFDYVLGASEIKSLYQNGGVITIQ